MILLLVLIGGFVASAINSPVQAESIWRTWTIDKEGQSYPLQYYMTNGSNVIDMYMGGYENKSLIVSTNSSTDATLTIRLPKVVLDYNPRLDYNASIGVNSEKYSHFSVFFDGISGQFDEVETTAEYRTLKIDFPSATKTIQIAEIAYTGLPTPVFGPLDRVYDLTIENRSYPIKYGFSGSSAVVESMHADFASKSITIAIGDNSTRDDKKQFFIELPRNIINSNTTEIVGGCSVSDPTGNTPSWIQQHDLDYIISIESKDSDGQVKVMNGSQGELCSQEARVLSLEYEGQQSTIMIRGNVMIPEFRSSVAIIIVTLTLAIFASAPRWNPLRWK